MRSLRFLAIIVVVLLVIPAWVGAENAHTTLGPYTGAVFAPSPGYYGAYGVAVTEKFGHGGRWEQERTGLSGAAELANVLTTGVVSIWGTIEVIKAQNHQLRQMTELEKSRLVVQILELLPPEQRAEFIRKLLRADP